MTTIALRIVAFVALVPATAAAQTMPPRFDLVCAGHSQAVEIAGVERNTDGAPADQRFHVDFTGLRWCADRCSTAGDVAVQDGIIVLMHPPGIFEGGTSFRWPVTMAQRVTMIRDDYLLLKRYTCTAGAFTGALPSQASR